MQRDSTYSSPAMSVMREEGVEHYLLSHNTHSYTQRVAQSWNMVATEKLLLMFLCKDMYLMHIVFSYKD